MLPQDSSNPGPLTDEQKWQMLARHEKLGEILLKLGKVTLKQLEGLMAEKDNTDQYLGELIVNKGIMNRNEVMKAVELQQKFDKVSQDAMTELKQRHKP